MKNILVIGAGNVGSHIVQQAIAKNLGAHFHLLDLDQKLTNSQILDLRDTLLFSDRARIDSITFDDPKIQKMDVIIITAGANQAPGETRIDLLTKNKKILTSIHDNLGTLPKHTIIMTVTNPVDIVTKLAQEIFPHPPTQIIGTGTLLDSARLRWRLADTLNISPRSTHGYVLGEHGDTEFVAWSTVGKAAQIPTEDREKIEHDVRREAYEIIDGKGATYFGIAAATIKLLEAILHDTHEILAVSTPCPHLPDETLRQTPLGYPAVIGAAGILNIPKLDLPQNELTALTKSAQTLHDLHTQR